MFPEPSHPMKYTVAELYDITQADGIGATLDNVKSRQIKDDVLADLWDEALDVVARIEQYLEDNHIDPFDGEEEDDY